MIVLFILHLDYRKQILYLHTHKLKLKKKKKLSHLCFILICMIKNILLKTIN